MNHYIKSLIENKKIKFVLIIIIFFQLFYIAEKKVNFKFNTLINSFKPNFGAKYILSEDILELKSIVNSENLKFISIIKKLRENDYFYQRSVEFLYPVRINQKKNKLFFSINEKIPNSCKIQKKYNNFILAKC